MVHTRNQRANYKHRNRDGGHAGFLVFSKKPQQDWARRIEDRSMKQGRKLDGIEANQEEIIDLLTKATITWRDGWKIKQARLFRKERKKERDDGEG